ncbi:MAG TPA: RNA-binding protein [Planctomycetota bacterium]|nr:RNA-binding protein [Planctomycetota bacterium]
MKITVGNLSFRAVESDLRGVFSRYGQVVRVTLSRGSGIVEMSRHRQALAAIRALQRHPIHGRPITVSEASLSGAELMDVQEEYADFVR